MRIYITAHAIQRYRERIDRDASEEQAHLVLRFVASSAVLIKRSPEGDEYQATEHGLRFVVADGERMVTVYRLPPRAPAPVTFGRLRSGSRAKRHLGKQPVRKGRWREVERLMVEGEED